MRRGARRRGAPARRRTARAAGMLAAVAALGGADAVAAAGTAAAQAIDSFGMGSRSTALAGAVTADVEDFSANYYNPAGLARTEALRIGVGYLHAAPLLHINGQDSNVDSVHGAVLGLVIPGHVAGLRFALGLGVHLNDERLSRARALPRTQPRWELYDNRPHRAFIAAHLAFRPTDWLTFGGGMGFQSTTRNELVLRGEADALLPESRTRLEHQFDAKLTTLRYPQLGIQIAPTGAWSFGAVYRGEVSLDNDIAAEADVAFVVGDPVPAYFGLRTGSVNAFQPQQVSAGVAWRPTKRLRVAAEVTWVDWSRYESAIGYTDAVLEVEVPPELADRLTVPDSITSTRPIPPGFEDRWVPRLGVETTVEGPLSLAVPLRAGYAFERSPAPPQAGVTNLVDSDRHLFSVGAGVVLDRLAPVLEGAVALDVHLQWSHLPERAHVKASLVDPVGDYRAGGNIVAGGISAEVRFE